MGDEKADLSFKIVLLGESSDGRIIGIYWEEFTPPTGLGTSVACVHVCNPYSELRRQCSRIFTCFQSSGELIGVVW
eukprot:1136660-Amorphochlora_amoeboformis.AAC.1